MDRYLAHRTEDGRQQKLIDHLQGTARLAALFAQKFGAEELAWQIGMAHDIGKYSHAFQAHLCENGPSPDHATAGGIEIGRLNGVPAAFCVMGHHGGLPDGGTSVDGRDSGTLMGRRKKRLEDYQAFRQEVELKRASPKLPTLLGRGQFTASFWTRMLFSCLVDADFLDTERFMRGTPAARGQGEKIEALCAKLDGFVAHWWDPDRPIDQKRCSILRECMQKGEHQAPGLFSLTVPTGGGKTVSSLAFGLYHARAQRLERVIYVAPYCSIIEQTAEKFREILGPENVLEHHANVDLSDDPVKKLAAENWDMPVVVTTAVQFFESLFANKTSRCRKLHNIAGSVIIFDEAQTLPLSYLEPCLRAIAELTVNYGSSCVLCTATQPALGPLLRQISPLLRCREICSGGDELYQFFRRVRFVRAGPLTDEELAKRLNAEKQALCIVGTRKQAQAVYHLLRGEGNFHLSTLMTPSHRSAVLEEIRARLKDGAPCTVVATSLIEAGVDVDFPAVYRSMAGLDSMIQAAGRCNREGRRALEQSRVWLFEPEDRYTAHLPHSMLRPLAAARGVMECWEQIDAPEAVEAYFTELYRLSGPELDAKQIVPMLEKRGDGLYPFRTVAENFHLIDQDTRQVLIPVGEEAQALAARLRSGERSRELLRRAGRHMVNVYPDHFKALFCLEFLEENLAVLTDLSWYDRDTGLKISADTGVGIFI